MNKINSKIFPFAPKEDSLTGQNREAYLVYFLCWTWGIIVSALLITRMCLNHEFVFHDTAFLLILYTAFGIVLYINKKGRSHTASCLFISSCILITSSAAYVSGGVNAPAMMTYLPAIFAGGILLGKRGGIATAIVCIIITFAIVMLQTYGLLPPTPLYKQPVAYWLGFVASAAVIGTLQYIVNLQTTKAFEKIRQQEERYHSLIDHASDPILLLNHDTAINLANSSACKLLGYTHEELLQMKLADLFTPEDLARLPLQTERLKEHKILKIERKWRTKNGTILDMDVHTKVLDGGGYLSIARDITERKITERKLRESEKKYRNIFENVMDVFFQTSLDGIILEVSPSIKSHTGYTREQLIGTEVVNIYYDHNDREKVMTMLKENGEVKDLEVKFRGSAGQLVYVCISGKLFRATDEHPARIDGVFNNITERKLAEIKLKVSEEKHRALTEHISDAIILINEGGNIIYQSAAVGRIGGYSHEELKGKTLFDLIHPDDVENSLDLFKKSIAQPGVAMQSQYRSLHKDGRYIWIEGTITNLVDNESVRAFIVNYHDVTERLQYLKDIEEQNKKLREIAWIQSHIVRAPLARMMGLVHVLRDTEMSSEEFKEWTEYFFITADELDDIIHDINGKSRDI